MANPNYFELFDLPVRFHLDKAALKKQFYAKSKAHHPDFHTRAADEEQERQLMATSQLNEAFRTLNKPRKRLQYILQLYGLLDAAGQSEEKLPPEFLMEMMELNEAIEQLMENPEQADEVKRQVEQQAQLREERMSELLQRFDATKEENRPEILQEVRRVYLEQQYILRLAENVAKFAPSE